MIKVGVKPNFFTFVKPYFSVFIMTINFGRALRNQPEKLL